MAGNQHAKQARFQIMDIRSLRPISRKASRQLTLPLHLFRSLIWFSSVLFLSNPFRLFLLPLLCPWGQNYLPVGTMKGNLGGIQAAFGFRKSSLHLPLLIQQTLVFRFKPPWAVTRIRLMSTVFDVVQLFIRNRNLPAQTLVSTLGHTVFLLTPHQIDNLLPNFLANQARHGNIIPAAVF
nr:hypothetical protein [uncultured Oscillibacter sp.]